MSGRDDVLRRRELRCPTDRKCAAPSGIFDTAAEPCRLRVKNAQDWGVMGTTRRDFLQAAAATALGANVGAQIETVEGRRPSAAMTELSAAVIAGRHRIERDIPTPDFFEGMLLGNGDVGVCVTIRPDALGLHIGKADSWDMRVSEDHYQHVVPFAELLKMWGRAGAEAKRQGQAEMLFLERNIDFFREYTKKVRSSYAKPWPRPWPCGIAWIHWDSRATRLVHQVLDPSTGMLTVELDHDDLRGSVRRVNVLCFVNWTTGHVCVSTDSAAPFVSMAYYPHLDESAPLPPPELETTPESRFFEFSCRQRFPALPPDAQTNHPAGSDRDRDFALCARLAGAWNPEETPANEDLSKSRPRVFLRSAASQPFRLDITLFTPRDSVDNRERARREAARLSGIPVATLRQESESGWAAFWARSAVEFEDKELERIWYHNQYFLACCLREGKVAPGLFGNWSSGRIGTAWHGDYHMNYNTQQVYWGVFSSNHVEQHLPYVELCENLLPLARAYAHDHFGMPGAFFPHSAYPVPSRVNPYPVPPWGYEICEVPWTVQSLWWHYLYTLDEKYLLRVYPLLVAAARFMAAYVSQGDDGKYHIIPTVSPENWGCTVDFRLNKDCIIDLALTEFLFDAVVQASRVLDLDESERAKWVEIRSNLAPYPKAKGPYGEVWLDVVGAPTEWVYSIPVTLAPVFPGEQVGIGLREEPLDIARRTARLVRLEGGDDLVYRPLILVRLGMLDLEQFKREVRYCLLPMGVAGDRLRQIDGRYKDSTDFDFLMRMGVWIENFSLPAVLNECMMQSYSGTIRLFPNTRNLGPVRFRSLRAAGAFLVSAAWDGHVVSSFQMMSEKGAVARVWNPWVGSAVRVINLTSKRPVDTQHQGDLITFSTEVGGVYSFDQA